MCDTGFTGNDRNCIDIDECAVNRDDCHANATCTDVEGSFTCACDGRDLAATNTMLPGGAPAMC